jgi:acid stress chaperone HdeB
MAQLRIYLSSLIVCGLMNSAAQGQVTIDVAKISCEQFRSYAITDPNNIALWVSGYYNGKRGNTVVNVQVFKENLEKVKDFCVTNPKVTVMQAVEEILGKGK